MLTALLLGLLSTAEVEAAIGPDRRVELSPALLLMLNTGGPVGFGFTGSAALHLTASVAGAVRVSWFNNAAHTTRFDGFTVRSVPHGSVMAEVELSPVLSRFTLIDVPLEARLFVSVGAGPLVTETGVTPAFAASVGAVVALREWVALRVLLGDTVYTEAAAGFTLSQNWHVVGLAVGVSGLSPSF